MAAYSNKITTDSPQKNNPTTSLPQSLPTSQSLSESSLPPTSQPIPQKQPSSGRRNIATGYGRSIFFFAVCIVLGMIFVRSLNGNNISSTNQNGLSNTTSQSQTNDVQSNQIMNNNQPESAKDKSISFSKPILTEKSIPYSNIRRSNYRVGSNSDRNRIYTASTEGRYTIWIENQDSSFCGGMSLYDDKGYELKYTGPVENAPMISYYFSSGDKYRIELFNRSECTVELCIGEQRETVKINDSSIIKDRLDFRWQSNVYSLVPKVTGEYYLIINRIKNGQEIDLDVRDEQGYDVAGMSYATRGSDRLFTLEADRQYTITISQEREFGDYEFSLYSPNPKRNISEYNRIKDYISYHWQKNRYEYIPLKTGMYGFTLDQTNSDCIFRVEVFDQYGYEIGYSGSSANLNAGEKYEIIVTSDSGTGNYTLNIHNFD